MRAISSRNNCRRNRIIAIGNQLNNSITWNESSHSLFTILVKNREKKRSDTEEEKKNVSTESQLQKIMSN